MSTIDGKDSKTRKDHPLFSGVLAYFPDALLAVAALSRIGNDKHNPGQPLHWSRDKSADHLDCAARHLLDAGKVDHAVSTPNEEVLHSTELAWRALANLQDEIERRAPMGRLLTEQIEPMAVLVTPQALSASALEAPRYMNEQGQWGFCRRHGDRRKEDDEALAKRHARRGGSHTNRRNS